MRCTIRIFLGLLLIGFIYFITIQQEARSQAVEEWVAIYDGLGSGQDEAQDITVDAEGNVYVTGWSDGIAMGYNYDYATVKYNSEGIEQWVARYNGPEDGNDEAVSLAVDLYGNVVVTGTSYCGIPMRDNVVTIKYNSAGVEQWAVQYDASHNANDWAVDIAIDADGNVYVAGDNNYELLVIKYNSAGIEQWMATYEAPNFGTETATALAIDDNGNAYVTGYQDILYIGENFDYMTIKFDSNGVEQWVASYNGPLDGYDYAYDIAVDTDGNVYVTGESYGYGPYRDYATVKYNSSGVQLWEARYNGPGNSIDLSNSIAVDSNGNVFVTGYANTSSSMFANYDYATIKYNSAGVEQWAALYNGPANSQDKAFSLALDTDGGVYVTGYSTGIGSSRDYATVKYNSEGDQIWVKRHNGPGNNYDEASALAVDQDGNVYVTGFSSGIETESDYTTVKYSQSGSFSLTLTPAIQPILIPRSGGSFDYNIEIVNLTDSTLICDLWCDVSLPDSSVYTALWGPFGLNLPSGFAVRRDRTQSVPASAPAGYYSYHCFLGVYPYLVYDHDSFTFVKLSIGDGDCVDDWIGAGESFQEQQIQKAEQSLNPNLFLLEPNHPNPFNATTTLSYTLLKPSCVKLTIYNLQGSCVATLADGLFESGTHEVQFNAADLSSGLYFARLETGSGYSSQKLLLLK